MNRFERRTGAPDANAAEIIRELKDRGALVVELERPVDIVIGYLGVWVFAEIKRAPGAPIRPNQKSFLRECAANGLPCILIDHLDDVDNWFPITAPGSAPAAITPAVKTCAARNP